MTNENADPLVKMLDTSAMKENEIAMRNEVLNSTMINQVAQTPRAYHQQYFSEDISMISASSRASLQPIGNNSETVFREPKLILKEENVKVKLFSSTSTSNKWQSPLSRLKSLKEQSQSRLQLNSVLSTRAPKVEEIDSFVQSNDIDTMIQPNDVSHEKLTVESVSVCEKTCLPEAPVLSSVTKKSTSNNGLMEFSSGSTATTDKMALKLAQLNARNKQRSENIASKRSDSITRVSKMDVAKTVEKFIRETADFQQEQSINVASDCTYVVNPGISLTQVRTEVECINTQDRDEHHMTSLKEWINEIVKADIDDKIEALDAFQKSKDANKRLREMLTVAAAQKTVSKSSKSLKCSINGSIFGNSRVISELRKRVRTIYDESAIPDSIHKLAFSNRLLVRSDVKIYADVGVQTELMKLLLSFHPIWLFIGLETVFNLILPINNLDEFTRAVADCAMKNLFFDRKIASNKKNCYGTTKAIVTPQGALLLHNHFLEKFCQLLFIIEQCLTCRLLPNLLCMFHKSSPYKSINDVLAYISREVMAGTTNLPKTLKNIGFVPHYKQEFFEEFDYRVRNFLADLSDGIILGRLVDIITLPTSKGALIVPTLRNPGGDRLRKISNVRAVLHAARERGIDVGEIRPELIVANDPAALIELVWRFVGIYVEKSDMPKCLRDRYEHQRFSVANFHYEMAALTIQRYWRGYKARKEYRLLLLQRQKWEQSAITLQKHWRSRVARQIYNQMREEKRRVANFHREMAALTIQQYWRGHKARKEYHLLLVQRQNWEQSAITLQKHWRSRVARQIYNQMREEKRKKIVQDREILEQAATVIQKNWRRFVTLRDYRRQNAAIMKFQAFIKRYFEHRSLLDQQKLESSFRNSESTNSRSLRRSIDLEFLRYAQKKYAQIESVTKECERSFHRARSCSRSKISPIVNEAPVKLEGKVQAEQNVEPITLYSAAVKIQKFYRGWKVRRSIEGRQVQEAVSKVHKAPLLAVHKALLLEFVVNEDRHVPICSRINRYLSWISDGKDLYKIKVAAYNLNYISRITPSFCRQIVDGDGFEKTHTGIDMYNNRADSSMQVVDLLSQLLNYLLNHADNIQPRVEKCFEELIHTCLHSAYAAYKFPSVVLNFIESLEAVNKYENFLSVMVQVKAKWYYKEMERRYHRYVLPDTRAQSLAKFRNLLKMELDITDNSPNTSIISTVSTRTMPSISRPVRKD